MKKFILYVVLVLGTGFVATAQTTPTKETKTKKEKKAATKKHQCTNACHQTGKCVLAHGEKGHKCEAGCKKAA